jgi:hypothetical protein
MLHINIWGSVQEIGLRQKKIITRRIKWTKFLRLGIPGMKTRIIKTIGLAYWEYRRISQALSS